MAWSRRRVADDLPAENGDLHAGQPVSGVLAGIVAEVAIQIGVVAGEGAAVVGRLQVADDGPLREEGSQLRYPIRRLISPGNSGISQFAQAGGGLRGLFDQTRDGAHRAGTDDNARGG